MQGGVSWRMISREMVSRDGGVLPVGGGVTRGVAAHCRSYPLTVPGA